MYLPGVPVKFCATVNGCDRNLWILRARHRPLVLGREVVHAENRDDVAQLLTGTTTPERVMNTTAKCRGYEPTELFAQPAAEIRPSDDV